MSLVVNSSSYHPIIILLIVNTKVNIQKNNVSQYVNIALFIAHTPISSHIAPMFYLKSYFCTIILEIISLYSIHPIRVHIAPMFYLKSICYTIILEKISLYSTHPISFHIAPLFILKVVNKWPRSGNVYVVSS